MKNGRAVGAMGTNGGRFWRFCRNRGFRSAQTYSTSPKRLVYV